LLFHLQLDLSMVLLLLFQLLLQAFLLSFG
jgi:hypothetical protein